MAADTRIFKFEYERGGPEYTNRQGAGSKVQGTYHKGKVKRIWATNADATAGWEDVTEEFRARSDRQWNRYSSY